MGRSSAIWLDHSMLQACMLKVSAVAPHQRPELGGHERVGRVVGAEAAVALRDGEGEQAGLAEVGVVLEGERRLAIVAMGARGEAVAAQRADQLDEALLLLAQRAGACPEDGRGADRRPRPT